jgi:hypothetical protein
MNPFEVYVTFLALKRHFSTPSYDYFKYHGKIKCSQETFKKSKDRLFFERLSRKKKPKEIIDFFVFNFVASDNPASLWIGDIIKNGEGIYTEGLRIRESLSYIFEQDLNKLCTLFDDNVIVKNGQHPYLLKQYLRREISIETVIILNDLLGFFNHWNKKIDDGVLWPTIYKKCMKYKPFFHYDMFKCRKILKDKFAGD